MEYTLSRFLDSLQGKLESNFPWNKLERNFPGAQLEPNFSETKQSLIPLGPTKI